MTSGDVPRREVEVEGSAPLVVGVGVRSATTPEALLAAVREATAGAPVATLATWSRHRGHPAVASVARRLGAELVVVAADALATADVPTPSERVARLTGARSATPVPSVAEAAVVAAGARLLVPKTVGDGCTVAAGRRREPADPLLHHGDAETGDGLVDLAVNVAVTEPPPWLHRRLAAALAGVAAYPDERPARAAWARELGADEAAVLPTNGAAQAFALLAAARRWRRPLVVHPQFTEPDAALRAAGHAPAHHVLSAADGFRLDPAGVDEDADLVVVGNPTNPTSRLHPARDLLALARPGRVVCVDEAFVDVVPGEAESLLRRAPGTPGLLVVRSLTKTFGLAGVRTGLVAGDPAVVADLERARPAWSVNSLALEALAACLGPEAREHVEHVTARLGRERDHLVAALAGAGLEVVPEPAGPFVLARHPRAASLRRRLRDRGYAVRRGDTFPGLGPEWLRVAVRPEGISDALARHVREILAEPDPADRPQEER